MRPSPSSDRIKKNRQGVGWGRNCSTLSRHRIVNEGAACPSQLRRYTLKLFYTIRSESPVPTEIVKRIICTVHTYIHTVLYILLQSSVARVIFGASSFIPPIDNHTTSYNGGDQFIESDVCSSTTLKRHCSPTRENQKLFKSETLHTRWFTKQTEI
jgi:hypothetical protein